MATPTVNFAFADFTDDTTGVHRVQLSPGYFGLTDEDGEIAFANVTPGIYTINAPGVLSLRITVPNAAGPYDAVDLVNDGQGFVAPGATVSGVDLPNGKTLVAGSNITLTDSGDEVAIASSGGGGEGTGFTDTDGALEIDSDLIDDAENGFAFTFDTNNEMVLSAGLFGIKNNGVSFFSIDSQGNLYAVGNITAGTSGTSQVSLGPGIVDAYSSSAEAVLDVGGVGGSHWFTRPTLGFTFDEGDTWQLLFDPSAPDATTPYVADTTLAHTSGNLLEVKNDGAIKAAVDFAGNVTAKSFVSSDALSQEVYSAGTVYSLTATPALVDFGTTDPTITVAITGTYMIYWGANIKYNAATFAANQTYTIKIRRTNNTAADISNATITQTTRIITTITDNAGLIGGKPVKYVAAAGDILQVWGSLSATPAAGSVDVTDAWVVIVRIQ